ncbi:MAG: hypothetical protein ABIK62_07980 [candidate division WOR-3 bacterium]
MMFVGDASGIPAELLDQSKREEVIIRRRRAAEADFRLRGFGVAHGSPERKLIRAE